MEPTTWDELRTAEADLRVGRIARAADRLSHPPPPTAQPALRRTFFLLLGNLHLTTGKYPEAKAAFQTAIQEAPEPSAPALLGLASVAANVTDYPSSIRLLQEAHAAAKGSRDWATMAQAQVNLVHVADAAGKQQLARSSVSAALDAIAHVLDQHAKARLLLSLASAVEETDDAVHSNDLITGMFDRALEVAESVGDPRLLSEALGRRGEANRVRNKYATALNDARRALFFAQTTQSDDLVFRWNWLIARLHVKMGHPSDAIPIYRSALAALSRIRADFLANLNARNITFRDSAGNVYLELAELLLNSGDGDQHLEEVKELIESVKAVELQDYFQDDCVVAWRSRSKGIEKLEPHTAALYPVVLPGRLELILSLPQKTIRVSRAIDRESLRRNVRDFRNHLETRTTRRFMLRARELYELLIAAFEDDLAANGIRTLVFVPDDSLRNIPLGALHDGSQFLVERFALSVSPGLTLTDPRTLARTGLNVLAATLSNPGEGYAPLPYAKSESEFLKELLGAETLVDADFRIAQFEERLIEKAYDIVHIASHGKFGARNDDTFVLTADGRLTMDALGKALAVTHYRDRPIELLTLSACQTAAGDDRAALGLGGVAIKSGARSALASLWYINDQATSELVRRFYGHLSEGASSKAEALRLAQAEMLAQPQFRHPAYWAPFVLIGNWL